MIEEICIFKESKPSINKIYNSIISTKAFKSFGKHFKLSLDKKDLILDMIECWQNDNENFIKNMPQIAMNYFIEQFVEDDRTYYKGVHISKTNCKFSDDLITSATWDINIAAENACGTKREFKDKREICLLFKVVGKKTLDISRYKETSKEEYIIYKPRFSSDIIRL